MNLTQDDCKTILTALKIARDQILKTTLPTLGMNADCRGLLLTEVEYIDLLIPKVMELRYSNHLPLPALETKTNTNSSLSN